MAFWAATRVNSVARIDTMTCSCKNTFAPTYLISCQVNFTRIIKLSQCGGESGHSLFLVTLQD